MMNYSVLEKSQLFFGLTASELREALEMTPHHIQCYDKGEIIFHLMEPAAKVGIVLERRSAEIISKRQPDQCVRPRTGRYDRTGCRIL